MVCDAQDYAKDEGGIPLLTLLQTPTTFIIMSLVGAAIGILGALISALAYRGQCGQTYSPLNHFISELGEVGVSRLAWVFNGGLILSGLCLIPAVIALGLLLPGVLSIFGMIAGVITAVGLSLVGVFPMNKLEPHGKAAVTFFRCGLLMVLVFSLAIAFQPPADVVIPRGYSLAGLPAILAFGSFLWLMGRAGSEDDDPLQPLDEVRPKIWILAVGEWSIFLTIVAWLLVIAVGFSS